MTAKAPMVLFKPFHVPLILSGKKTQTRRLWKKPRAKVGSIHNCCTRLFGEPFARVRILNVYQERLGDMAGVDYANEGSYTKETFIEAWTTINGSYDPEAMPWVVEFSLHQPAD